MKKGSYLTIQDWMITDLHLKGNELLAYALIYGFSQDEQSCFYGSYQYVMKWLSIDRRSAMRILQKLEEKGLLRKWQEPVNGVMTNRYAVVTEPVENATNDPCQNATSDKLSPVTKCTKDPWQNVTPTRDKMSPKKEKEKANNNKPRAGARAEERDGLTVADVFDTFSHGAPAGLYDALMDFDQYRRDLAKKDKKKLWNAHVAKTLCKSIRRLTDKAGVQDRAGYVIAMLNQSIENGWTGVFAVRDFVDKAPEVVHIAPPAPDKPRKITKDMTLEEIIMGGGISA